MTPIGLPLPDVVPVLRGARVVLRPAQRADVGVEAEHALATAHAGALRRLAAAAPARRAAMAHNPEPDARSNTRRPATASGCSRRCRAIASPPAHAIAQ